jgi:hypothetical protein
VTSLKNAPFNLPWGSSIYAKVIASNMYGDSDISPKGNGAVIITSPDTPINLAETEAMRTPSSITLSWTEGLTNGGSAVIDYRVNYDQATGDYV